MDKAVQSAIDAALDRNDYVGAAALAEAALAAGQNDPMLLNLAAWRREEAGDFASAHELLDRARALAPSDPTIVVGLGSLLRKEGRLSEAVSMLDYAIGLDPGYVTAWLERGVAFDSGGALREAAEDFQRAAALDPQSAAAHAGIASVAARLGHSDVVATFARRALAIEPDNQTAVCALALSEIEAGAFDSAIAKLEALVRREDLPGDNKVPALTLLGDCYEKMGRTADAFASYGAAQEIFADFHSARFPSDRRSHLDYIDRISRALAKTDPLNWAKTTSEPVKGAARKHVFLLGYPRSGTTLVENILASSDEVEALEERPTLVDSDRIFLADDEGIPTLSRLDAAALRPYREAYWKKVSASGIDVSDKIFVDMDPFKGIKLPLIAKLFPDAHIVVMRRDPRDIVWSCFHTHFRFNDATFEFTTIEKAAAHYDAAMRLIERCLEILPLNVHYLRYDALVADFDATTAELCSFIGLLWSPALRQFSRTAQSREVSTASLTQVRKGLYDGRGRWRTYQEYLAPVLPILRPWIEKFGFEQ